MSDPNPDPAQLAAALKQLAATLRAEAGATPIFVSTRRGARTGAILLKRTYKVDRGNCVLAPPEEQSPICGEDVPWEEVEPPKIAPLIAVDERLAFRPFTDVIVQARAFTYGSGARRTTASVRVGQVVREIVVFGDRRGERDLAGRWRFSEPEPFESMPVRWDKAYGGFDAIAPERGGMEMFEEMKKARPSMEIDMTPYHYPRNPCGAGFITQVDARSFDGLAIPNLEHPFAPLTPERLATGGPAHWMRGPLPAAWDWQPMGWFPRVGYLGMTPPHLDPDLVPEEVKRGLVAEDLLKTRPITHVESEEEVRLEIAQAAAPGMTFRQIAPDERFEFKNLHRKRPQYTVDLPGEVPELVIEIGGKLVTATPHLDHVVHRLDLDEVEMLWSARFPVPEKLRDDELLQSPRVARWNRAKKEKR